MLGTVGCARLHGQALRADAMFSMWRHIVQQRPELLPQLMTGLAQAPPPSGLPAGSASLALTVLLEGRCGLPCQGHCETARTMLKSASRHATT